MRFIPWLAVLALPFSVFAHEKEFRSAPDVSSDESSSSQIFERLHRLYEGGSAPVYNACGTFAYAGRCFSRHRESATKGAGYAIRVTPSDNGPIDPGNLQFESVSVWSDDLDEYDTKKVSEVVADGNWHRTVPTRNGLRTRLDSVYSSLRSGGGYLVEKITDHEGRTLNYCYYYLSLTP